MNRYGGSVISCRDDSVVFLHEPRVKPVIKQLDACERFCSAAFRHHDMSVMFIPL